MCLIIDNNVIARVLCAADDPELGRLRRCLFGPETPRVRMTYGGKLRREYLGNQEVGRILGILDRAGRAIAVPDSRVDDEEARVAALGACVSDDPHVIALARVGKVRLLCSLDAALHEDFRNPRLLDKPRGKIYGNASHHHLLEHACGDRRRHGRRG